MENNTETHKLNVFSLPNQTTILFALIVLVLLGAVAVGSVGSQPFMIPLVLGLLFLPLRAFLAWPEREFEKHGLNQAGDEFAGLAQVIENEAHEIGLPRTPKLVIGEGEIKLHIFGSFKRWYIAISRAEAECLQADLDDKNRISAVHAMFVHELYHFKNGDYWQMGYARELLQAAATFVLWAMAFLMGFGFFLLVVKPDFIAFDYPAFIEQLDMLLPPAIREFYLSGLPPVEEIADLQQKAAGINMFSVITFAVNATLPFVIVGGVLWLFYWRKLMRIREFYADAGVAHTQENIDSLCYAFILGSRSTKPDEDKTLVSLWNKVKSRIKEIVKQVKSALAPPTFVRKWFSMHPEFKRRIEALEDPTRAYDHWLATALSLGGLTLILDILLATPLTLPYQGQWPMHFSVMVISVVVTLALMTPLVLGKSIWWSMLKIIGVIVALRFVWLMLTLGVAWALLIVAPDLLAGTLDAAITSIARDTSLLDGPIVKDLTSFMLQASFVNIAQVFIVLISLVLLIGGNIWLLQRLFTWYSFPQNEKKRQLLRIAYGIITVTTTSFSLSILTPVTTVLLGFDDTSILAFFLVVAFGFVIAAVGLGWFFYTNHKYARRCTCGEPVPGPYHLGKRCDKCKQLLHLWLIAEYEL